MKDHNLTAMQVLKPGSVPYTEWKPEQLLVLDLETNLKHDTIWCCGYATQGSSGYFLDPEQLMTMLYAIDRAYGHCQVIVHNGNAFDLPVLERVWGIDTSTWHTLDTWVLENLLNPGSNWRMLGLNVLAEKYLGIAHQKQEFDPADFDKGLTQKMIDYCVQDCKLTYDLVIAQLKQLKARGDHPLSLLIEQETNLIVKAQERKGVLLDLPRAMMQEATWADESNKIHADMVASFRPTTVVMKTKTKVIPFNPSSRPQIVERLMEKGWKPKVYTDHPTDPKPKLDEDTMESLEDLGFPEAKMLGRYFKINKMLAFVRKWIDYASKDGRIHGRVNTNGAATSRMTHEQPNLGQIPAHDPELGPLCRACFTVPEGYTLVGTDAKSLEERVLSHYINDPEYTQKALTDGHSYRRDLLGMVGIEGRRKAKTWFYALLYGGGDAKLGYILKGKDISEKTAKKVGAESRAKFINALGGLKSLVALIKDYYDQKQAITLIDGRWIKLRSAHSALNALLQGSGAIVMKVALIIANNKLKEALPGKYAFVLNVHDEFQTEVDSTVVDKATELLLSSFTEAGELLQMRCPIEGDAKVGPNWAQTH